MKQGKGVLKELSMYIIEQCLSYQFCQWLGNDYGAEFFKYLNYVSNPSLIITVHSNGHSLIWIFF